MIIAARPDRRPRARPARRGRPGGRPGDRRRRDTDCTGIRVRPGASTASLPVSGTGPGTVMVTVTGHRAAGRGAGRGGTTAARQGCSGSGTGTVTVSTARFRLLEVRPSGLGDCLPWLHIEPSPQSLLSVGLRLGPLHTLQHSRTLKLSTEAHHLYDGGRHTHIFSLRKQHR